MGTVVFRPFLIFLCYNFLVSTMYIWMLKYVIVTCMTSDFLLVSTFFLSDRASMMQNSLKAAVLHCEKLYTWATRVLEHATEICLPSYNWLHKSWSFIHINPRVYELWYFTKIVVAATTILYLPTFFLVWGTKKLYLHPIKRNWAL